MNKPLQSMTQLIEKIRHLPAERIAEVEDFVDFLQERTKARPVTKRLPFNFPVISVGQWPQNLSLSREDIYTDDGR